MPRRSSYPRTFRRSTLLSVLLILAIVATACGGGGDAPTATPLAATSGATAIINPPASAVPSPSPEASASVSATIDRLLLDVDGVYGVMLMKPEGKVLYSRNADTPFIAASLYKLVLMAEIYEKREAGDLTLDQTIVLAEDFFPGLDEGPDAYFDVSMIGAEVTIEEALFATGAYSSNVGARALLTLTDQHSLEQTARDLGLHDTHLFVDPANMTSWPPGIGPDSSQHETQEAIDFVDSSAIDGPVNITTPRDMSIFFSKLIEGEIVNQQVSQEILETLGQQMVDDRFPTLLPIGTQLVHKTGNLDHVVHDVGIIYCPSGPVILAAMAEGTSDDDVATQIIQRLAVIAYDVDSVPLLTGSPIAEPIDPIKSHDSSPTD